MFTRKEKKVLEEGYFTVIREEEQYIELVSKNTRHQWIIFKTQSAEKPVTLHHKHTADTKYYRKHWQGWSVAKAVEVIM